MSAENDIARARKKPIPQEKMKELLTKARKGATASFTFAKLVQILDLLGWEIEPISGWTPLHYMFQGEESLVNEYTKAHEPSDAEIAAITERRDRFENSSADSLPEAGSETIGEHVVMNVSPMKTGSYNIRYFSRREWVGTEGVKITSPRGEEAEFLPDHHELGRGTKSVTDSYTFVGDAWRWFKEEGIEDDIATALGTEKHIPAAERTRENTGTCAHCWGNFKLEGGRLVLHGYKRPRWGYTVGQCHGVRFKPIERSPDGAKSQLELLETFLSGEKETLSLLESGKVTEIPHPYMRNTMLNPSDPMFKHHLGDAIEKSKRTIKEVKGEIAFYEKVIAAWHERPMPKQGELQRGPGFFTE